MNTETIPLVLIAGTGGTEDLWGPVIDLLDIPSETLTVTSVGDDPDAIARDVLDSVRAQGVDRFHLAGESLGAVIATHLAADHSPAVESLLLLNGWAQTDACMHAEFDLWDRLLLMDPATFAQYLPLMAFGPNFWREQSRESVAALSREIAAVIPVEDMRRQLVVDHEVDVRPLLSLVGVPTTVVSSRHDRLITCAQARALVAGIADSQLRVLDTGHGAVLEDPAAVAGAIDAHLDAQLDARPDASVAVR